MKSIYFTVLVELFLVYVTTAQLVYEPVILPDVVAPEVDTSLLSPFTDSFLQLVDQSDILGRVFGAFQVVPEVYDIAYNPVLSVGQFVGLENPEDSANTFSNIINSASNSATPRVYAIATANTVAQLLAEFGLLNPSNAPELASQFANSIEDNVLEFGQEGTPNNDIAAITNSAKDFLGSFNILNPDTILRFGEIFGQQLLAA